MSESDRETIMWKVEPLSPSGTPPLEYDYEDEKWLFLDQKPAIPEASGLEESGLYDEQLTRAQVASKFLEELELKNWIKEESFADWFEEKIDIPIFEDLPAPECGQNRAAVIYTSLPKPQPIVQQHQQQQQQQQQQVVLSHHQAHHHHQQQQQQQQQQHQHVDATQSLLREFETVLGDVEACHQITSMVSTLTPPQSPPPNIKQHHQQQQQQQQQAALVVPNAHLLVSLQPLHHQNQAAFLYEQQHQQHHQESVASVPSAHSQRVESYTVSALPVVQQQQQQQQPINDHWNAENLSLVPLGHINDVVHELAKVDEYVLNCAANVGPSADASSGNQHFSSALSSSSSRSSSSSSTASNSSPPSPCTSSNASCISSEDSADDPDWSYEPAPSSSASGSGRRSSQTGRSGRRASGSKPYSRPNAEDKRVRKKEQNKNAATRYRQKKKQEVKEILGEERELVERNDKLQAQLKDLQREIGYLKGLMRDLFKAKGLIK